MELLALICALRMAKFLGHSHSIDTVKPVLGESHHHFRNYTHAHSGGKRVTSRPAPGYYSEVKTHVEKRKRDREEWTQHEEGNVLADVAASSKPDQLRARYPTSTNISITASALIFQVSPPDVWNAYKEPMTPVPWTYIIHRKQIRMHEEYVETRTANSALIHRNRDWTSFNMELTNELWENSEATTLDKQRVLKIIYDFYWHGGNRSNDQMLNKDEQQDIAKYQLCDEPESQNHLVLSCSYPIMKHSRDYSKSFIEAHHVKLVAQGKGSYRTVLQRCIANWKTQQVQDNIHMWIGRWPVDNRVAFLNGIPNNLTSQAALLKEALKNMYSPILAHVYHAHALRIHLLRGRIPTDIKSAYTNPWYDDVSPLPIHPLRRHRILIDKEWDASSQESVEPITVQTTPQRATRRGGNKRKQGSYLKSAYPYSRTTPVPWRDTHFGKPTLSLCRNGTTRREVSTAKSSQTSTINPSTDQTGDG
jgi:hypothetical protein